MQLILGICLPSGKDIPLLKQKSKWMLEDRQQTPPAAHSDYRKRGCRDQLSVKTLGLASSLVLGVGERWVRSKVEIYHSGQDWDAGLANGDKHRCLWGRAMHPNVFSLVSFTFSSISSLTTQISSKLFKQKSRKNINTGSNLVSTI